jgi:hypothetical protein
VFVGGHPQGFGLLRGRRRHGGSIVGAAAAINLSSPVGHACCGWVPHVHPTT